MAEDGQNSVQSPHAEMRELYPDLLNQDFIDFLRCIDEHDVESILVGGYAVVLHGYFRTTGDLDLWVRPTSDNYHKLRRAFAAFGLPTDAISESAFLSSEDQDVFTFGRPPVAIDILTQVKGLEFGEAYKMAEVMRVDQAPLRLLHLGHLKAAKQSAGRHKDLDDLEHL
jgi:hypothetical protein